MSLSHIFQLPKPQRFLFCIPLRSAFELIVFITLINKISGLYGILALFTGYDLNFTQLSYYIYNLVTLTLVAWLATTIRQPEAALKTVALAWLYILDTVINTIYTFFFMASWFSVLAGHLGADIPANITVPGQGMIEDTAGFTSPEVEASHVEVSTKPSAEGLFPGQDVTVVASTMRASDDTLLQSGGLMSLALIGTFLLIRIYFCLLVLSYARGMLRHYIVMTSSSYAQSEDARLAENPFRQAREEGQGFKGRLGRMLMCFPSRQYWLGMDNADRMFRQAAHRAESKSPRARMPSSDVGRSAGMKLEQ